MQTALVVKDCASHHKQLVVEEFLFSLFLLTGKKLIRPFRAMVQQLDSQFTSPPLSSMWMCTCIILESSHTLDTFLFPMCYISMNSWETWLHIFTLKLPRGYYRLREGGLCCWVHLYFGISSGLFN